MKNSTEELIFYGDDVRIERFPRRTTFIYPNPPIEPLLNPESAISDALDNPLGARRVEEQLNSRSRVTIAFDDPCLPIPLMRRDIRGKVIEDVLNRLFGLSIPRRNIRLICANGLHRKWTIAELALVLGRKVIQMIGADRISCHDATEEAQLVDLGTTSDGMAIEINRAVAESDLTIYVNVNFTSMNGGWKSTLVGLGSWRSIRCHHTPREWNGVDSIMEPEHSPMHRLLSRMGQVVKKHYPVFQIETVINNQLWPRWLEPVLSPLQKRNPPLGGRNMSALLCAMAASTPARIKRSVRNWLRSDYRPAAIHAGDVDLVHARTLARVARQQNVPVDGPADIVVFGVPNLSPYSARSIFNPILLRSVVLGYMRGLYQGQPLVKDNGVIIASNPGIEKFHHGHHPSYVDFWQKDLSAYYDPEECWEGLADAYAEDSGYLDKYRHQYAYHGTHSLINWFWGGMALRRVKSVILAGARQPETAKKMGFVPAKDLPEAISLAMEMTSSDAQVAYPFMPPLFCSVAQGGR